MLRNKLVFSFVALLVFSLSFCNAYSQNKENQKHIISHVTVTCYQPVKSQCDSQPLVTADGSKINLSHLKSGKIKWCAISRDLLWMFPKDKPKRIWVEGMGIFEVRDVMNKRFTHRVDILQHPKNCKLVFYENVKIKIYQ